MRTLLVTRKMAPELAARIEASVRGTRVRPAGAVLSPRQVVVVRFALGALAMLLLVSLAAYHRRGLEELEGRRAALLGAVRAQGASLAAEDKQAVARAESWLLRGAGAYEGDGIADETRAPGALAATLARGVVYVHGPIREFASSAKIADLASTSAKDSFVLCLVATPAPARTERALLAQVRTAYSDAAALEQRTSSVHRLYAAEAALPLLLPPWAERVHAAREPWELAKLQRELDAAPIAEGTVAASAPVLLFVMDEPGDGRGPTEIDGERSHEVRVGLVDVRLAKVLLRLRIHADPDWISPAVRSLFASGLDACRVALDVRERVEAGPTRGPSAIR